MPDLRAPATAPVACTVVSIDAVRSRSYPPAADLADCVIDYGIHDSGPPNSQRRMNRYLPGPANICMLFDAGPLHGNIRNRHVSWQNDTILFGPTSTRIEVESNGGRMVGLGLTPVGWTRLIGAPAHRYANRMVPLGEVIGATASDRLRAAVRMASCDAEIVMALDNMIRPMVAVPFGDEPLVQALHRLLLDPDVCDVATILARLDLTADALRRLATRHFGFPPKLLIRRTRFVRALMLMAETEGLAVDFASRAPGYHDRSHFLRDARLFLGVTGRQFLREITPLMDAMRATRRARFGTPLQGLIAPGRDNLVATPSSHRPAMSRPRGA